IAPRDYCARAADGPLYGPRPLGLSHAPGRRACRCASPHAGRARPRAAGGRSARVNRTFQDRLVNELRVAGITTLDPANAYLSARFIPEYNATFQCVPANPASAFVALGAVDLDQILCHEEERVVAADNTVSIGGAVLQVMRQPGRRTCAGRRVLVRRHLSRAASIWVGTHCLGRYPAAPARCRDRRQAIQPVEAAGAVDAQNAPTAPWKTQKPRFPQLPPASL